MHSKNTGDSLTDMQKTTPCSRTFSLVTAEAVKSLVSPSVVFMFPYVYFHAWFCSAVWTDKAIIPDPKRAVSCCRKVFRSETASDEAKADDIVATRCATAGSRIWSWQPNSSGFLPTGCYIHTLEPRMTDGFAAGSSNKRSAESWGIY